jgi:NADH-quinone oxidoreductase subunit H
MTELHPILTFLKTWWIELLCGAIILMTVPLVAAYFALAERKLLADMRGSRRPSPEPPASLWKRVADTAKFLLKPDKLPANTDNLFFRLAPIAACAAPVIALAAIVLGPGLQVARDIDIGLLFVVSISFLGIFGIFFGGWASTTNDSSVGAMRVAVRFITFQTASALALVGGVLLAGTLQIRFIVEAQQRDAVWFGFLAPVAFVLYVVASHEAVDRRPREPADPDAAEPEMKRYGPGGFRWALYLLAEYNDRIVVSTVGTTLFLGGWLRPFPNVHWLNWVDAFPALLLALAAGHAIHRSGQEQAEAKRQLLWVVALLSFAGAILLAGILLLSPLRFLQPAFFGAFWFLFKIILYVYFSTALRFAFPSLRLGRALPLGWKFLIPVAIVNIFSMGLAMLLESEYHWNRWLATFLTTMATLGIAHFFYYLGKKRSEIATLGPTLTAADSADSYVG